VEDQSQCIWQPAGKKIHVYYLHVVKYIRSNIYMYKDLHLEIQVHRAQILRVLPVEQQTAGSIACKIKGTGVSTDGVR